MKYAFTNLACPAWSIEQVVDAATRLGYDGVELRLLDGEVIDPRANRAKVERAVALCRSHGTEVCAFDTSCRFNQSDVTEQERQIADLLAWIGLAHDVQVPLLRVFGGPDPEGSAPVTDDEGNARVAAALRRIAPEAERAGVTVVLETHDAFSSARRVASVLERVGSTHIAALWDSHHPYRMGESPEDVIAALDGRIAHVHVKDARRLSGDDPSAGGSSGDGAWQLVLLGEGEVPVRGQLAALRRAGYNGYVAVEWEKKWHPEIEDPEVALPQHIAWLRERTNN
jgi:sugar phosphate isomerase/epimerase